MFIKIGEVFLFLFFGFGFIFYNIQFAIDFVNWIKGK